jgi:hypothetical protein
LIGALGLVGTAVTLAGGTAAPAPAAAQGLPEIRTHERNKVPACVTPARLMRFLATGNARVPMRFADIARHYKEHGERHRIRWDYAFFQMILETNYLKFKNNAGQGDVDPGQNNFAGIGTTGGGVPGDRYPDVSTGVLAQMQHLVAYSGERVESPVGRRTREKQDEIIQRSKALGRAVTFQDLTRRWAVDRRYGSAMEFVAGRFRAAHCTGRQADEEEDAPAPEIAAANPEPAEFKAAPRDRRARRRGRGSTPVQAAVPATPTVGRGLARRAIVESGDGERSALGAAPLLLSGPQSVVRPTSCKVFTASYGGEKNMLVRAIVAGEMHYTALQVLDGLERRLADSFIRSHAKGGDTLGEFPNREAALLKAFDLCPMARAPQ